MEQNLNQLTRKNLLIYFFRLNFGIRNLKKEPSKAIE